jgi:SAM-dependent methyltransferase
MIMRRLLFFSRDRDLQSRKEGRTLRRSGEEDDLTNRSVGPAVDQSYLLSRQYRDSKKLEARANLHRKYGQGGFNWFEWIAQHARLSPGMRVLDIGCGTGWLWEEGRAAFPSGLDLMLADLSPAMVADAVSRVRASGHYPQVEGQVADAMALPFADGSFDAVIACHMLYHVPDARAALVEFRRVLRPGGVIAVTTNTEGNMGPFYALGAAAFGGAASDPAAEIFGLRRAGDMLPELFDDVQVDEISGDLHVTDAADLVLALTSFPPGDDADEGAVSKLLGLVETALQEGDGTLVVPKRQGMVRATKLA